MQNFKQTPTLKPMKTSMRSNRFWTHRRSETNPITLSNGKDTIPRRTHGNQSTTSSIVGCLYSVTTDRTQQRIPFTPINPRSSRGRTRGLGRRRSNGIFRRLCFSLLQLFDRRQLLGKHISSPTLQEI